MNACLQTCEDARQILKSTALALLDNHCSELLSIYDDLMEMAEESEIQDSCAVVCALCAAAFRNVGSARAIDDVAMKTLSVVNNLAVNDCGAKKKLIAHQSAIKELAKTLMDDCRNDLMHLTSEIDIILEHPLVAANNLLHSRLQRLHDVIEDQHVEGIYEAGCRLEQHPIMKINAASIVRLKVIHSFGG